MPSTYRTQQGDTWDIISLRVYDNQKLTNELVEANPSYRKVRVFGAGTVLTVPDVTQEQVASENLPPWRRG